MTTFKYTTHDGKIRQNRKESKFYYEYTLITHKRGEGFKTPLIVRLYATQAKHYACLWLNHGELHLSGGGSAGGYGYHRASAAVADALDDAGIVLQEPISGRGDTAIRDAIRAIAHKLGYNDKQYTINEAHA